jgi:hydroxymethylpyrimidine/phosphomethylpyrimidine kinase
VTVLAKRPRPGRVLIVAGSDSGGGAGIQADIKTVTVLGAYAATAITAITVQNTLGVSEVFPIPNVMVEAQARAVLSDIGADAIKTGMLGDEASVKTVVRIVDSASSAAIVVDPVMVAKGGAPLLDPDAVGAIRAELIPRATLLTPNAPEAAVLTGLQVESLADLRRAGEALLSMGARAVLMKGGHLPGPEVVDVLMTSEGETRFQGARMETRHTHGTGCSLASACAAGISQGMPLREAVSQAWRFVRGGIAHAPELGAGHGPIDHAWMLRSAPQ